MATKSKVAAGLLGIFLGGLGIHKFYLGKTWMGILYLVFCWTYIPAIIGFIEGIVYLASSDIKFHSKYGKRIN
ncbi:TM2 domain-containing protein [Cohnella faecalis]|uniref:TM2 domain-containing protein n=1 Tax=Cohnella faecalis TaxID=2315694 RepID=UPI001F25EBA0|nr:NINE protein [Cohnella faecalis]